MRLGGIRVRDADRIMNIMIRVAAGRGRRGSEGIF